MLSILLSITWVLSIHRLTESERRYRSRDSKPEDLEAIQELRLIVQEQERKIKELVVSSHHKAI